MNKKTLGLVAAMAMGNGTAQAANKVADGYNEFGFKLLRHLAAQTKTASVSISPYSVASVLALAHNGAAGKTRLEIAKTLNLPAITPPLLNEASFELTSILRNAGPKNKVAIANGVWTNKNVAIKPRFISAAKVNHRAQVQSADFGAPATLRRINDFVGANTAGKIPSILDTLDDSAVAVLVNAVYFKGVWQHQFDPAQTRPGDFSAPGGKKQAQFMAQTGQFQYLDTAQAQVLTLTYDGGKYAMTIALPKGKTTADGLLKTLNAKTWRQWSTPKSYEEGTVKFPRLKINSSVELSDALAALGMPLAFQRNADFSNLTSAKPVWISRVNHKTVVEVNEKGTEAAAATGMTMMRGPAPKPFTFTANRPFLMSIQENHTGTILFLSRVTQP